MNEPNSNLFSKFFRSIYRYIKPCVDFLWLRSQLFISIQLKSLIFTGYYPMDWLKLTCQMSFLKMSFQCLSVQCTTVPISEPLTPACVGQRECTQHALLHPLFCSGWYGQGRPYGTYSVHSMPSSPHSSVLVDMGKVGHMGPTVYTACPPPPILLFWLIWAR